MLVPQEASVDAELGQNFPPAAARAFHGAGHDAQGRKAKEPILDGASGNNGEPSRSLTRDRQY